MDGMDNMNMNNFPGNMGSMLSNLMGGLNKSNESHTALGPNTPMYIDKRIISMRQLYIGYNAGVPTRTAAINQETLTMDTDCKILESPKEAYADYVLRLEFGPGFAIDCTPGSVILCPDDYKTVKDLKEKESKIQVTKINLETKESFVEDEIITNIDHSGLITNIKLPMYTFVSEYYNIFIPFEQKGTPLIWLVNFEQ